jgi:hypothetical protein
VELYTHSKGGITANDVTLAALLDGVPVAYSKAFNEGLAAKAAQRQEQQQQL